MGGGGLVLAAGWGWELANWPQPSHSLSPASSLPNHHHHHWQERHTIWSDLNDAYWKKKKLGALQADCCVAMVPHWGRKEEENEEEEGARESDTYTGLLCGMAVTVHLVAMHPSSAEFRISVLEHSSALVRCVPQALLEVSVVRLLSSVSFKQITSIYVLAVHVCSGACCTSTALPVSPSSSFILTFHFMFCIISGFPSTLPPLTSV